MGTATSYSGLNNPILLVRPDAREVPLESVLNPVFRGRSSRVNNRSQFTLFYRVADL